MSDFAIVAEGITDQRVLENILVGCTQKIAAEPDITYVLPPNDETSAHGPHPPGGWSLVIRYFKDRRHLQALQLNRYLVAHIDTDVASEYGVSAMHDGRQRTPVEMVDETIAMFRALIGADDCARYGDRILFAIGVDSIECWLLPLVYDESEKAKRAKVTGCVTAMNERLRRNNAAPLSIGDEKAPKVYEKVSRGYSKRKTIDAHRDANAGLDRFVAQVDGVLAAVTSSR